ncbi:MAG: class I SAM-dependent methyltransferase [Maricaulaceae bacterium]
MSKMASGAPPTDTTSFGFETIDAREKAPRVRAVFDRVANRYDLMNDLMSAGVHRIWKDIAIARANPQPGETLIDAAGGTGDLARRFLRRADEVQARRGGADARAVVFDINEEMLQAGRKRGADPRLAWVVGDAETPPFEPASADVVTIAFGIRNVTRRDKALAALRALLKPGGRFLCLEFSHVPPGPLAELYDAFSFNIIPQLGRIVAQDADSYRYLVESIRKFPDALRFESELRRAGFAQVSHTKLSGGVAALHTGWAV